MRICFTLHLFHCLLLLVVTPLVTVAAEETDEELTLSIIHFNDFHARFDEQSLSSGTCKPEEGLLCEGGFSRMFEAIERLTHGRKNPLVLNAGDDFQGTLWYTLFRWNVTQQFLNLLPTVAHAIGNHEFDDHVAGLVPYLTSIKAKTLVCNLDDSLEPSLHNLHQKSTVLEIEGKRVGIVGVSSSTTAEISNSGRLVFLDEVTSVNKEVDRLVNEENVFTTIVLSHAGIEVDREIARKSTKKVALIVGGHSHTFLYNGLSPDGSIPSGPYPTVIRRELDGQMVPIVQASSYTKYLGDLVLTVNRNGEAGTWTGSPLWLSPYLPTSEKIDILLEPYKRIIKEKGAKILGQSAVALNKSKCRRAECNLGNLITDVMVQAYRDKAVGNAWTYASLAIMNAGGIRTPLSKGNITYEDMVGCQPFDNTFDVGHFSGTDIRRIFERSAEAFTYTHYSSNVNLLQVSGFQLVFDLSKPIGNRVKSIKVLCSDCETPKWEQLKPDQEYKMIVPSFLGRGGDGFNVIPESARNYTIGPHDMPIFEEILPKISPIRTGIEGRIKFVGKNRPKVYE